MLFGDEYDSGLPIGTARRDPTLIARAPRPRKRVRSNAATTRARRSRGIGVPARSTAFGDESARMRFRLTWLGGGYGRINGGVYAVFLVITDDACHVRSK